MNTKQLREKFLSLAIEGKLVPQDASDEPAIELLKRFNPKIKPITENVPFEVPESWVWCKLGDIGKWQSGATPSRHRQEFYGGDIPWLKTGDLNDGYIYEIPENITQKALEETSVKLNPVGSVLIAMYGATIGKLGILTFPATTNQACCACVEYKAISQMYLFYFLLANRENFISIGMGGAQPNISKEKIEKTFIPLPPLAEQHRIVERLEYIFSLIDTIEQAQDKMRETIKATRQKLLSLAIEGKLVPQDANDEPAIELLKRINPTFVQPEYVEELPKGWSVASMSDICDTINGLWKGKKEPFVNVGVIRNANFTKDFKLDFSKIEYLDVEEKSFKKRKLINGDLIVEKSGGGDKTPVGRTILYDGEDGIYSFSNFTMLLRIKDKKGILPKYLYYFLLSEYWRGTMFDLQTQTTGLHNLLTEKFLALYIPIPPLAEQKRIVQKLENLFSTLETIESNLN